MTALRNRLDEEQSPYLHQHADNPVHWQPWDDEALAAARERDVPIFLSVGYSACHWCHVMADESFADEATAELVNEQFVPIKVDREERPDLDSLYQTICQLVTGSGGWPLSVWCTPDGKPFYVGTYFPDEPKHGRPSFRQLCSSIADSWNDPDEREKMEGRAEQWTSAIEGELEEVPDQPGEAPDEGLLAEAAGAALRSADREHGGFGTGQKFPQTGRIHVLARAYDDSGRAEYARVVRETLAAMATGGLYDHVGGGFHRYTTDREWVVPHFEKMLYDQAEIARAMLVGHQLLDGESEQRENSEREDAEREDPEPASGRTASGSRYATAARETFAFVERELTHPDGGFYSTLDAQSGGEEGTFYVWTPEQVHEAIDDGTDADLFCDYYSVDDAGNFEGGTTVLTVSATLERLAEEYDVDETAVADAIERAREQAFDAREERTRPPRDEKVLASWNGLMVSAFAEGALVLDDDCTEQLADAATSALAFCRDRLWDADAATLSRRWKDGDVKVDGYLEDYAFLARGALNLYEVTGDVDHLGFALDLAAAIEDAFWDADRETLYFTPQGGESLVVRPQERYDQSTPSSMGVAASVLLSLDGFVPHDRYRDIAERTLATNANRIRSDPMQHASLVLAADEAARGHVEVTMAAETIPDEWRATLSSAYLPRRLLAPRPASTDGLATWLDALGFDDAPPVWSGREARDGPTAFCCVDFACSPPQDSLEAALEWRGDSE